MLHAPRSALLVLATLAATLAGPAPTHAQIPQRFGAGRVAIHVNGGLGMPTGMIGGSLTLDLPGTLFVEAGGGWDIVNGGEATVGLGTHVLLTDRLAVNPVVSYTLSEGTGMAADFGCDRCGFEGPGHWLNLMAQLELRTEGGFTGRLALGVVSVFRGGDIVPTLGAGLSAGWVF